MTFDRICGKCGAPISSEDATCPKCPPTVPPKKAEAMPALLVIAVLCTSLLMLGTSVVNVVNAPDPEEPPAVEAVVMTDRKAAAYEAARNFIQERFPGDKEFADLNQSVIKENGDNYLVTISADELQGASPARHLYKVELNFVDGSWVLKDIRR